MTVGIAAIGSRAGSAILAAAQGVELLGRGSIGGFAVFTTIDVHGELHRATTQRGGVLALSLTQAMRDAPYAALISSGPDRPEPLSQFLAADPGIGLVTGHRLPNRNGVSGIAVNAAVLSRMSSGSHPQDAVEAELEANPEADAGLIAVDLAGRLGIGNTVRVKRRNDTGMTSRSHGDVKVAVLHNAISAHCDLARLAADIAWGVLTEEAMSTRLLRLGDPVPLVRAPIDRVHINAEGIVIRIESANPNLPTWHGLQTAIYLGSEIWQSGQRLGQAATELFAEIQGNEVVALPNRNVFVMQADRYDTT